MLNRWNNLSQDNKVKLIIVMLTATLAAAGYLGKNWFQPTPSTSSDTPATVTQTTAGESSPTIANTKGDVTLNINSPNSGKQP